MRAAKVQASLCIRAVSPEPSLLAHTSSESRGTFRQKARSLAPLNGWACAVKICHDGMLEDTNSLDGAHILFAYPSYVIHKNFSNLQKFIHLYVILILIFTLKSDSKEARFWISELDQKIACTNSWRHGVRLFLYRKTPKNFNTPKITAINLKFKPCGSTIE